MSAAAVSRMLQEHMIVMSVNRIIVYDLYVQMIIVRDLYTNNVYVGGMRPTAVLWPSCMRADVQQSYMKTVKAKYQCYYR